jgi:hypothetical protein
LHPLAQRVVPEDGRAKEVACDAAGLRILGTLTVFRKLTQQ